MRAEGWAAHTPLSIENAIRTFYRPSPPEQPEYNFDENSAMPEVQALAAVIREYRPNLIFSLHNCGIAFPNIMVTDRVSAIVDVVARAAAESGFTNFENIGDFKGLEQLGPGVFHAAADSPWARIADYASRHEADRATVLAVEGPMWRAREPGLTLAEAADIAEKHVTILTGLVDKLPSVPASDLYRAATMFVAQSKRNAEGYRAEYEDWRTQTEATPDDPAPVANDAEYAYEIPLRAAGVMWRFTRELLVPDLADTVLDQVEHELDEYITKWSQDYGREFGVEPMRFANTVAYQLKIILATSLASANYGRALHDGHTSESDG
jgi:hypothetical protein